MRDVKWKVLSNHMLGLRETNDEKYVIYFLYEDINQSVHVDKVDKIDFLQVIQHLDSGGSVLISKTQNPEFEAI